MTIFRRYAKGLSISLLSTATFCMGAPLVLAQGQAPTITQQAVSIPENLLAVVKLPPLPELAKKVTLVSQKAELDAQTQMFIMFFLSQFGFPTFPGVSPTDDVTLFVLRNETDAANTALQTPVGDIQFVILAKMTADSPFREVIKGRGLQIQDREGWTLVAMDPTAFSIIKDFAGMAAIADSKEHFDIEMRVYSSKAIKDAILNNTEANLAEQENSGDTEAKLAAQRARGWLQFAIEVLDQNEWVGSGLSVDAQNIRAGMALAPKAGTASAKLINTPTAAGKVKAGEFFASDVAIGYVGKYDIPAIIAWLESFSEIAKRMPDAQATTLVQEALDQYTALVSVSDGGGAGVVTEFNADTGKARSQSIQTGTFELAKLDTFYDYTFNTLVPNFVALFDPEGTLQAKQFLKAEVKTDVAKAAGKSVNLMTYTTSDPQDESKAITQENYYTVINGTALFADNLDSLQTLATTYVAGKPVANNLADTYPLPANTWFRGAADIKKLAQSVAQSSSEDGENAEPLWLSQLNELDLKPVQFDLKAERGHAVYSASLALDSVVSLIKLNLAASEAVEEVEQ